MVSEIECIKDMDCCTIVTEWDKFRRLKPEDFIRNVRYPCLIDNHRIYDSYEFNSKLKFTNMKQSTLYTASGQIRMT